MICEVHKFWHVKCVFHYFIIFECIYCQMDIAGVKPYNGTGVDLIGVSVLYAHIVGAVENWYSNKRI